MVLTTWVSVSWDKGSGHAWLLSGRLVSLGGLCETKPVPSRRRHYPHQATRQRSCGFTSPSPGSNRWGLLLCRHAPCLSRRHMRCLSLVVSKVIYLTSLAVLRFSAVPNFSLPLLRAAESRMPYPRASKLSPSNPRVSNSKIPSLTPYFAPSLRAPK